MLADVELNLSTQTDELIPNACTDATPPVVRTGNRCVNVNCTLGEHILYYVVIYTKDKYPNNNIADDEK
jgi:hypothetical protein